MKKIATILILTASLAFAADPVAKAATDSVITKPTKEQLAKATPLNNTICPVSKEKIGNMGAAVPVIYKGKIVNLCCNGCPGDFAKDPEKYMKIVNEEVSKNKPAEKAATPAPAPAKDKMGKMEGMDHSTMQH